MGDIYLQLHGEQKGPFAVDRVRAMLAAGEVTPETLAWHPGLAAWSSVGVLLGLPAVPGAAPVPQTPVMTAKPMSGWLIALIVIAVLMVLSLPCCCGVLLGPITNGIKKAKEAAALQKTHAIALAMLAYANDHNGHYPDAGEAAASGSLVTIGGGSPGASTSTEIFQKLIDGHYVTDPTIFYLDMPGKVKPVGDRLASNNVCFDETAGLTASSPGGIPLVYPTGYTVSFSQDLKITRGSDAPYDEFIAMYTGGAGRSLKIAPGATVNLGPITSFFAVHLRQLEP